MAIYGIGAYCDGDDLSEDFINNNLVSTVCINNDATDLHIYF